MQLKSKKKKKVFFSFSFQFFCIEKTEINRYKTGLKLGYAILIYCECASNELKTAFRFWVGGHLKTSNWFSFS